MPRKYRYLFLTGIGVIIMLIAFVVFPDNSPWYHEVLLFDLGLILTLLAKFRKLKKQGS